ncbi:hypothetical protein GCM10009560_47370 [Nonomuraea longicatena]|uniref:Transposase n=1 Tax=Nonomuraea longicatena TaxID=83682 RepID=A0ABP4ANA2_9ACTN
MVSVDSTTARAHRHAAGMVLGGELAAALEEAAEQEKGYVKGRNACDGDPGRDEDRHGYGRRLIRRRYRFRLKAAVLERIRIRLPVGRPRTRPGVVAADKAYSSRGNRAYLRRRGIKAVIPEKADQAANRKKRGSCGGGRSAVIPISTRSATRWSGASTGSRNGVGQPSGSTRRPTATWPACTYAEPSYGSEASDQPEDPNFVHALGPVPDEVGSPYENPATGEAIPTRTP